MRIFIIAIGVFTIQIAAAQERFFYMGKEYGSEAIFNPITLILNGGYDITQLDGYRNDVFSFPYARSAKNVFRILGDPFSQISKVGWSRYISNEIFPLEFKTAGAQWWPNYQLHLIGGGMTYVAIREWYEEHHFPSPALFSLATMAVYHLLNETMENDAEQGDNVDPIADIYVFDIGGIVLFSFDSICRFFRDELHLADWSLQPSFVLNSFELKNAGQYFSVKWKIPFWDQWHVFYYFGLNGLLGASYSLGDGNGISAGIGLRAQHVRRLDPNSSQKTADLVWNAGVFYDRDNSLLASLFISGLTDNVVNINIYPGFLRSGKFSPGLWLIIDRSSNVTAGITTIWMPGVGLRQK